MTEREIPWEQIDKEWDQPLPEDVTTLCCGTCPKSGKGSLPESPEISWRSDIEPRILSGLPFAAALLGSPPAGLLAVRLPRPAESQSLADCFQFWSDQSNWQSRVVSGPVQFPRLVPTRSQPFSNWRSRLLVHAGVTGVIPARPEFTALAAGTHQLCDDLNGSHEYSQAIEGMGEHRDGDYWHAIMHRREPDYRNSCYWFRRVGRHPLFPSLAKEWLDLVQGATVFPELTAKASAGHWDPMIFVHACEVTQDPIERELLEGMQYRELLLLYRWTFLSAFPQSAEAFTKSD